MNIILSIAGSDSGGGAGIQADIKSAQYHGVFSTTAITAITAQNTTGVQNVLALDASFVQEQIKSVLSDFDVKAIKIGMLGSKELILAVKESLKDINIPIILDPVAISRAGSKLLDDDAIESLKEIFDLALIITPNKHEAKLFFNVEKKEDILNATSYNTNILFKNLEENENTCTDILLTKEKQLIEYSSKKANTLNTHGTGCSFSSSIASIIAKGKNLDEAIIISKEYIYKAIEKAPNLGSKNGPINHMLKD
ncbi:MAG: bifunctional hydroxymethylpyrimidine kinase/phosphomethylpyrimidine kinase [Poseidonibacter sp.]|uniref:bifunctional hydroxymethylpyrimidine kinase/phosphomethylpyrimidine kinase n=1 Tax=Poseidonibacter sp. TaxID=2321188 RepID=UPI00359D6990